MEQSRHANAAEQLYLSQYDITQFDCPSIATDVAVFSIVHEDFENHRKDEQPHLHVLLIKRGEHPFMEHWALPGGFMSATETVEECALREIQEETNLSPVALMPIGVFSQPNRDPRGRIVSHAFASIVNDVEHIHGGSDARHAQWFRIQFERDNDLYLMTLSSGNEVLQIRLCESETRFGHSRFTCVGQSPLAFDHAEIMASAISTLRHEADRIDVVFDFLPEIFTLSAMQRIQETLLGVSLLPANFRRKISDYVEKTDQFTEGAGHRPAQLYRRKHPHNNTL